MQKHWRGDKNGNLATPQMQYRTCKEDTGLVTNTFKISIRPIRPGLGIYIFRSNRPGLTSAGSRISGLFVEAMVITSPLPSNPSKQTRSWKRHTNSQIGKKYNISEMKYALTNLIKSSITFLSARTFNQTTLPSYRIQFINEDNRWSL